MAKEIKLEVVDQRHIHPILQEAILDLISASSPNYKFYGQFFMYMNIKANDKLPTAGVYMKGTKMYMDYNHDFVSALTLEQAKWLLFHEIKHLLYKHINRTKTSGYDHKKSNIVQDMIINSIIKEDFDKNVVHAIKGDIKVGVDDEGKDKITKIPELLVPPEYDQAQPNNRMYEPLYRWVSDLEDEMRRNGELDQDEEGDEEGEGGQGQGEGEGQDGEGEGQGGQGQGEGQGNGNQQGKGKGQGDKQDQNGNGQGDQQGDGDGQGNGDSNELNTLKDMLKNSENGEGFDVHNNDESTDVERETMNGIINGIKARGFDAGHFENMLEKLKVTKKDNLRYIKQQLNAVVGTKPYKSFMREHRYGIEGAKGDVYRSCEINAILDVSGSMGGGLIEKVLANINQNNITINLILADTRVTKVYKVNSKKDLQKVKIVGYGGTELQPAIDYVRSHKEYKKNNTVVLTDGYCDHLDFTGMKGRNLIITCGTDVVYTGGRTKQIHMEVGDL